MATINISGDSKSLKVTALDVYAKSAIGSPFATIPYHMLGKIYVNKDENMVIVEVQGVKDMPLTIVPLEGIQTVLVNEINGVAPTDLVDLVTKIDNLRA